MPLLEIDKLRKDYGGLRALDGVSLDVPQGSIIGLIGPKRQRQKHPHRPGRRRHRPHQRANPLDGADISGLGRGRSLSTRHRPRLPAAYALLQNDRAGQPAAAPKSQLGEHPWHAPWHNRWARQEAENAQLALDALRQVELAQAYDKLRLTCPAGR